MAANAEALPTSGRAVSESLSHISEMALPNDANPLGNLIGGRVMHLVDIAGAIAASRHSRRPVVTASVDYMNFLHPIRIGQMVSLNSSVNRVFNTSMEVGVKVCVEDLITGEVKHTSTAYLTFVALGEDGKPMPVAQAIPQTEEEIRRWREAGQRREWRLTMRKRADK
jgi:acyl-CoA hydrolase